MTRADQITPRDANEATALGFFTNLMARDMTAFADLWAPDAVQEMPFWRGIPGLEPAWHGKETLLAYYRRAIPGRRGHVFHIDRLHRTTNPDVVIVEAHAHSLVIDSGRNYDQQYVFIFHLRDGRIVLNREHFNPVVFRDTFPDFQGPGAPDPEPGGVPAPQMQPATPAEELVKTFYCALMDKAFDRWTAMFTEDARQENPFMPALDGLDAGFVGRDRIAFHYRTALARREGHVFRIHAVHQTTDPDVIVAEVAGTSRVPETGRIYDQRYVWIFHLRNGLICRMQEYFNPLAFEAAFEGFLVGDGAVEH